MPYRLEIHAISVRKLDIRIEIAGSLKNGRGKTPIRNSGETHIVLLPTQQFPVIIVGKRVILHRSAEENRETKERERTAEMGVDRWRRWSKPRLLTINFKTSAKCCLQLESPIGDSQTKFSARNCLCAPPHLA